MQRLVFFPDYYADPLWDFKTGWMVNLDVLDLPHDLRDEVRAWAATWTATGLAVDKLDEALEQLEACGRALWERLHHELHGTCAVGYATFAPVGRLVQWSPASEPVLAPVSAA